MDDTPSTPEPSTARAVSRRTLIRLLVGAAIGIPIAVEGRTLIGLVDKHFFGGERHERDDTERADRVGVGDEVLPETAASERISDMYVEAPDETWTFHLVIEITNHGEAPYEFSVGPVTTTGGTVDGRERTEALEPGASTTLNAAWTIPEGSKPTDVSVRAVTNPGDDAELVERVVSLGNVPVKRRS